MQISRHWRLNSNRYRLEGVRYENGTVSLQERPAPTNNTNTREMEAVNVKQDEKNTNRA